MHNSRSHCYASVKRTEHHYRLLQGQMNQHRHIHRRDPSMRRICQWTLPRTRSQQLLFRHPNRYLTPVRVVSISYRNPTLIISLLLLPLQTTTTRINQRRNTGASLSHSFVELLRQECRLLWELIKSKPPLGRFNRKIVLEYYSRGLLFLVRPGPLYSKLGGKGRSGISSLARVQLLPPFRSRMPLL